MAELLGIDDGDDHGDDDEVDEGTAAPPTPVLRTVVRGMRAVPELRAGLGITVALALAGALGRLVLPYAVTRAIDDGFDRTTSDVDLTLLLQLTIWATVAVLASTAAAQYARYRLSTRAEAALAALRLRAIDRILALSVQQHTEQRRGVLVARVTTDVETMSQFFSWGAIAWVLDLGSMVVVAIAMFFVDWRLALVAIVTTVPMLFAVRILQQHLLRAYDLLREHVGTYLGRASELVGSAALIRGYDAHAYLGDTARLAIRQRRDASIHAQQLSALMFVTSETFLTASMALTILVGLGLGPAGGLTAGTLIGFTFLVTRFLEPVSELTEVTDQTQLAAAGLVRILDLLDLPVEVQAADHPVPLPAGPLSVSFSGVTYEYPPRADEDRTFALRDLALEIAPGERVAIVGATGSGKSTLAKLLVRTADPTSGTIAVGGVALDHVSPDELRRRVQLVPQEPFLFSTSLVENVRLAAPTMHDAALRALFDDVGLSAWVDSLPAGWDTEVGERGGLLSAGERQLVALARARAGDPDLLVLDEATSSVDAATEARLSDTIAALSAGRTTIVIAHRLTTVARADRVVVLDAGRIVESGRPDELAAAGGHYRQLVDAWERANSEYRSEAEGAGINQHRSEEPATRNSA